MSRVVYLVRHEESYGTRDTRHEYGPAGAGLIPEATDRCPAIASALLHLGVDLSKPVASSTKLRAHETARYAGFTDIRQYAALDEINTALNPEELKKLLAKNQLPLEATEAAIALLEAAPRETVWFTHGQLIRAIGNVLGAPHNEPFIPAFGSITTYTIGS